MNIHATAPVRPRRLRTALRRDTAERHEALHRDPAFAALADGSLDRAAGAALMHRLAGFYAIADPRLARACQVLGIAPGLYRYVPRTPRLAGWAGPAPALALPALPSVAALAGAAYVLDGALLGGAVLDRASRGMDWIGGYWAWCRADGPSIWRTTLRLLDSIEPADHPKAIATARDMFDAFGRAVGARGEA